MLVGGDLVTGEQPASKLNSQIVMPEGFTRPFVFRKPRRVATEKRSSASY